ncbi:4-hydroxyphenylpyruvate dioxygenase [Spirulina subsalsa FACHB-351]|uniref:4-hydroxyphenylpyruvate dioxygenase n=1 Tax=Spirulina subsalsa FACHB-351 TaxID=234711 RepID=A0ABT3L1K0_9CYAN|nr:4-hydroxyphenylpyruvate dioxygenase [Spirulina subsalsa]MCW6035377.1 4-hydroxyphenylpyruvate dioxygenase [Spirulina subsalsa FACHB-351]
MKIEQIEFFVKNAQEWRHWFEQKMGFQWQSMTEDAQTVSHILSSGEIQLKLSSASHPQSPVFEYLQDHPPGVVNLVFHVQNLDTILERLTQHNWTYCAVQGYHKRGIIIEIIDGLTQTLLEDNRNGLSKVSNRTVTGINAIDHLVLNVPTGQLEPVVKWYSEIFDLIPQQQFTIQTEQSGLYSQVLVHPQTGLQLAINEPTSANSQIQEFLDYNGKAGIQHIALRVEHIVKATKHLSLSGVRFLTTPDEYYQDLKGRIPPFPLSPSQWQELEQWQILVEHQPARHATQGDALLLQIFTEPIFGEPTFFFELIERRNNAQGFGEGNFTALFKAIERQQLQRQENGLH